MEFINLKEQYRRLQPKIDKAVQSIMANASFIGGAEVEELETRLASYVGRKHCVSCGNGTDALMLVALAYGIGEGDAVFCPDMTFVASVEPFCMLGATPVFVDIDETSYNIDPVELEAAIVRVKQEGKYTAKAVIMVDFLGIPADYETIKTVCEKHGLLLIEDAAQGMGARYQNKMCGSLGDVSCTSFFPSKPLGCYGDGGAVFTDSDEIASILRSYKVHGKGSSKYDNIRIGVNSRLDTIQAAVLLAKLDVLEEEMEKRQEIAARYDEAFHEVLQIPRIEKGNRCAYAQYVMLAKDTAERNKLLAAMKEADIPSLLYYPKALHRMDAFRLSPLVAYPNADRYAECNFGVPFSPYLTKEEQELVIQTVLSTVDAGKSR